MLALVLALVLELLIPAFWGMCKWPRRLHAPNATQRRSTPSTYHVLRSPVDRRRFFLGSSAVAPVYSSNCWDAQGPFFPLGLAPPHGWFLDAAAAAAAAAALTSSLPSRSCLRPQNNMSGKASGAQPQGSGEARNRQHHDGSSGRAFTVEQKAAVIRIKRCGPTAYYEILGLEDVKTTCSDSDIKKAYRKLSLLTHPDKNGYDGADEAFKLVAKAFQVLSDPEKKKKYDAFGGDPDARFNPNTAGAGGPSPFSNYARGGGGRAGFQEEMTPEELFRQFFGGGFGGPFGTSCGKGGDDRQTD